MYSLYTGLGICVYYALHRQSLNDDLYLLVQLEKWQKIQGRYSKDQFLTTQLLKQTPKNKKTSTHIGKPFVVKLEVCQTREKLAKGTFLTYLMTYLV